MPDNDFFEIPGATGDTGGSGEGQGASDAAPADRNTILEGKVDRLGEAINTLMNRDRKTQQDGKVNDLKRQINAAIGKKQREVDAAENALAEAYEDGDGVAIAKAQRKLSEVTALVERMKAEGTQAVQRIEADAEAEAQQAEGTDTTNLDKWRERNKTWFGPDYQMTQDALAIGQRLEEEGNLETGSHQYYEAIDREMQRKYPDRLKGSPGGAPQPTDTGGTRQGVTRIPQPVADGWRRMGIDIDDPEVAKRMLGRRQTAVDKGILPEEPRYGRVIER